MKNKTSSNSRRLPFQGELKNRDIIELTIQNFINKKLRILLTVVGIGIGVAVVYFLVSLTFGLQKLVIGNIATDDSLLTLDVIPNTEINDFIQLNTKTIQTFEKMDSVDLVSPVKSLPGEMALGKQKTQTTIYGVDQDYYRLSAIGPDEGKLFTDKEESSAVVSSPILSLFNIDAKKAIGSKFTIALLSSETSDISASREATMSASRPKVKSIAIPKQFTIVGVVNDETDYILIHRNNFDVAKYDQYRLAKVKVTMQDQVDIAREKILSMGFMVSAMTDTLKQINQIFQVTQAVFTVIGVVALLVAAIGMFNTMTITLLERTREIGIMKAIGATDGAIQQIFLTESIVMGLGGGFVGLGIGFILTVIANTLVNAVAVSLGGKWVQIFYTPPWFLALAFGFSVFIGFGTGYLPSKRAAKLNPLDALRYE